MQKNEDQNKSAKLLFVIISQETYDELVALLEGTHFQSLNELCRHIIEGKRIVAQFIDGPPDELLVALRTSYKDLQQKCAAIDQHTKMIYGATCPIALMTQAREISRIYQEVTELLDPIQSMVIKISKRWIPENTLAR